MPTSTHTLHPGTALLRRLMGLLLLVSGSGWAQPVYFEVLTDYMQWVERSSNPVLLNDSIYWTCSGIDFGGGATHLTFQKIANSGLVQQTVTYADTFGLYESGSLVAYGDSGILCLTSFNGYQEPSDVYSHRLTAFDMMGTVMWERTYVDTGFNTVLAQLIACEPSGFLTVGQKYDATDGDMSVLRVDGLGNELWRKSYGGSNYDAVNSAVQTPDGGFLLLGWTRNFGASQRDFYLVKTDSNGEQQWQRTYGGGTMETGTSVIALSGGDYLLAGAQITGGIDKGKLIKINETGSVTWQEEYLHPESTASEINKVIELNDGSIIAVGVADSPGEGNAGWLIKTDSEGNLIWQRKYNKNQYTDLFYSVLATADGGFLLSGQAINEETNSQDAWLLKVDSIGCPYPNCTVGIEEEEKTVMVDVWPNPVDAVLNIEKTGPSAWLNISVFDLNGKEILRFTQNDTRASVDVSTWPPGLYILRGTDSEGRSFAVKVVKE